MKRNIMRKNEKGFTLVELLVVIVIIGIITVLALPGVQQLQSRNSNKKYETYASATKSAGKLYTDAYKDDMFGTAGSGCYDISYSELYGKSLVKDFATDGITCDDPDTFVQVKRSAGKYTYEVSMKCKKGTDVVYDKVISTCDDQAITASDIPVILVNVQSNDGYDGWSTAKEITIKIASKDGLTANSYISYGWTTDPNILPADMKTYNYRNDTGVNEVSMSFTESGRNGQWYLVVDGDNVIDVGGRYAKDEKVGALKFDNTKPETPVLNNPNNGIWVGSEYVNADKYVIGVTSSDTPSGIREYQYRYPNSAPNWVSYSNSSGDSFTTTPFKTARDENVEIRACDYAGNCSEAASSHIRIDKNNPTCTISRSITSPNGENDWYKSNVTLSLSTADTGGSTVSTYDLTTSSTASFEKKTSGTQSNTAGITWYGHVKDVAGNVGICNSGSFKVDISAPAKPVLDNPYDNVWVGDAFVTANKYVIGVTSSDTPSGIMEYQYRYPDSAPTWVSYENSSGNSFTTTPFKTARDENVEIRACDYAGNCSEAASSRIKIDRTSPTCTVSFSGTTGDNGWYKSNNATVSLSVNDDVGTEGLTYDVTTSTTPTYARNATGSQGDTPAAGTKWYGYVKDAAGNVGSCSNTVKVDVSSPTCTVTFSGTAGDNGWYKAANATATVNPTENGSSGIAAKVVTTSATATYSGNATGSQGNTPAAGTKWYGYVKDNAGNVGSCNNTVKVDKSSPTCTVSFSGTTGDNGWYKAKDATATVNPTENGNSGIAAKVVTTSATATYTGSATGSQGNTSTSGTKWYGYVKDAAGNVGSCSNTVKVDKSSPTCTVTFSGTAGDNGWYKAANATATVNPTENGSSGIAAKVVTTSATATYSGNATGSQGNTPAAGTKWYGYVKDAAGNVGSCSNTVKVDKSSPTCTVTFSGTAGSNGWYKAKKATATVNPTENGNSGIAAKVVTTSSTATYSGSATGSQGDTASTKWYGYVKDSAGNVGSCSNTVKVDTVAPTCSTSKSNTYSTSGVTVAISCTDGSSVSGMGSGTCAGSSGSSASKSGVTSTTSYTVVDTAGNSNTCSVSVSTQTQYRKRGCNANVCAAAGCKSGTKSYQQCQIKKVTCYKSASCNILGKCTCSSGTLSGKRCIKTFNSSSCLSGWTKSSVTVGWSSTMSTSYSGSCTVSSGTCSGQGHVGITKITACSCSSYKSNSSVCACSSWGSYGSWGTGNYCAWSNTCSSQSRVVYY